MRIIPLWLGIMMVVGPIVGGIIGVYLLQINVHPAEADAQKTVYEPEKTAVCSNTESVPYLKKDQAVAPQWGGGPLNFYRNDTVGHKCLYENTWMGVDHQFIFAEYCTAVPFDGNYYDENSIKPT